jgi:hypothetical protein
MPTLNKPSAGDTDWTTEINDNWTALENQLKNAFQGRLQRDSATQVSLQRYIGDVVEVNGKNVSMGAGGIALATTDNLIDQSGLNAGSAMQINTPYYVYLSNASASYAPSSLRASTTAPPVPNYNGVKYLGTSGNAANWRFVGWLRTNGSTEFVDDPNLGRLVINYYNRRPLSMYFTDNTNSWNYTLTTWRPFNNVAVVPFIANGEDAVNAVCGIWASSLSAINIGCAIGITSDAPAAGCQYPGAILVGSGHAGLYASYAGIPTEGYQTLRFLESSTAAGTTTWYGDNNSSLRLSGGSGVCMG